MALPPVFAASALYDSLLQSALRQFFGRATFETEPIPSLSSDGRLAIEFHVALNLVGALVFLPFVGPVSKE